MPRDRDKYNAYMRDYMAKRYAQRHLKAIELLGGKCSKCERCDKLEIDHIDRTGKSFTVCKKLAGISWSKFLEEIKKCQLLCPEHHIEKTVTERGQKLARGTHGSLSSYRYCRCDLCKKAKNDYQRALSRR